MCVVFCLPAWKWLFSSAAQRPPAHSIHFCPSLLIAVPEPSLIFNTDALYAMQENDVSHDGRRSHQVCWLQWVCILPLYWKHSPQTTGVNSESCLWFHTSCTYKVQIRNGCTRVFPVVKVIYLIQNFLFSRALWMTVTILLLNALLHIPYFFICFKEAKFADVCNFPPPIFPSFASSPFLTSSPSNSYRCPQPTISSRCRRRSFLELLKHWF